MRVLPAPAINRSSMSRLSGASEGKGRSCRNSGRLVEGPRHGRSGHLPRGETTRPLSGSGRAPASPRSRFRILRAAGRPRLADLNTELPQISVDDFDVRRSRMSVVTELTPAVAPKAKRRRPGWSHSRCMLLAAPRTRRGHACLQGLPPSERDECWPAEKDQSGPCRHPAGTPQAPLREHEKRRCEYYRFIREGKWRSERDSDWQHDFSAESACDGQLLIRRGLAKSCPRNHLRRTERLVPQAGPGRFAVLHAERDEARDLALQLGGPAVLAEAEAHLFDRLRRIATRVGRVRPRRHPVQH